MGKETQRGKKTFIESCMDCVGRVYRRSDLLSFTVLPSITLNIWTFRDWPGGSGGWGRVPNAKVARSIPTWASELRPLQLRL